MKNKFIKPMIAIVIGVSAASFAHAADISGNVGKVTFSGELVDAACDLAPSLDGTDVKVDFGSLSVSNINTSSVAKNFNIKLQNCDLASKKASMTFTSTDQLTGKNLLGVHGEATGVAIGLKSSNGAVELGKAAELTGLTAQGDNTLNYTATLQKADADVPATVGAFESIADFQITYN